MPELSSSTATHFIIKNSDDTVSCSQAAKPPLWKCTSYYQHQQKKVLPLFDTLSDKSKPNVKSQFYTDMENSQNFLLAIYVAKVLVHTLHVTGTALEGHHSIWQ